MRTRTSRLNQPARQPEMIPPTAILNRATVQLDPRHYDLEDVPTRYFFPGELEALLHLYESVDAKTVIEFGVNSGRNPLAAFRNIPSIEQYVGIEIPVNAALSLLPIQQREVPHEPGELVRDDPRFELIVRPRGTFDLTPHDLPKCDAVFIDADHSRRGVEHDYALARKLVRPGGVIIFHDDNGRPEVQVTETLNDICAGGAIMFHVNRTWLTYQRVDES